MKHTRLQDPFTARLQTADEHLQANRPADAERTFRAILYESPAHPAASFGLGMMFHRAGADEIAIGHLQTAVSAWPQHLEARFFLAVSLGRLQRIRESAGHYEIIIRNHPNVAEAHNNLGIANAQLGLSQQVEKHFLQALKLQPSLAETHKNLGTLYREEGRINEARDHLEKAIAFQPHFAEAYWQLACITKFAEDDNHVPAMESSYRREDTTDTEKMKLAYALGKAFHDLQKFSRAFQYWREANSLRRKLSSYEIDPALEEMRAMKRVFSATFCTRADRTRTTTPALLFIVGMPRSGTTLTEQILASHSTVFGAGELDTLDFSIQGTVEQFPGGLRNLSSADWETIRERYLEDVLARAGDATCVSDKLPANFLHIGTISRLFPDAKIIHCRRNAMDTGLSCFRNYFTSDRLGFTCDLADLGRYYRHYLNLMEHWKRVQTASIYDIHYESLVTEPEHEVRKLLEFCELPFEAGCLTFYENKRSIKSASAIQVRQPMYRDSLENWKHYEHELQPMKMTLEQQPGRLACFMSDFVSRFRDLPQ